MGDWAEGLARMKEAEKLSSLLDSKSDDEDLYDLLHGLAKAENASGDFAKAEKRAARALTIATRNDWKPNYRRDAATALLTSLLGQHKYAAAIPILEKLRGWRVAEKATPLDLAWYEMSLAVTRFAAGQMQAYQNDIEAMLKRHEKTTQVDLLTRTAWSVGISPGTDPELASAVAKRLGATMASFPKFSFGFWSLALTRLRAGDIDGAEEALKAGGPTWQTPPRETPFYPIIWGLCSAKRGDLEAAQTHLQKAEELIAASQPSPAKPFAYTKTSWTHRLLEEVLIAELRGAITTRELAPPPRELK
jgi:tetratricopeptide (TPR) repeat protein